MRFSPSFIFLMGALISTSPAWGQVSQESSREEDESAHLHAMAASDCSHMEVWDITMGMCMPLAMAGMPMRMLMVHGNSFGTYITEQGPRGRSAFAAPNMFMADIGTSLGDRHYLNLDFMGTLEKWTLPERGYPELLQIGESDSQGRPFIDSQHPHSSPIMGLTLSDTIHLGEAKDYLRVSVAPRGESTDGPIAFMHRPTGMVNPDAPLGHHIGQDVGHISSTVLGASLQLNKTRLEASTFHGAEPEPTKVDLPLGSPNSYSTRVIQTITDSTTVMASAAYIKAPEEHDPDVTYEMRYSASAYQQFHLSGDLILQNALIFGAVTKYDHAQSLLSFAEEFWLYRDKPSLWGRLEVLQRTPAEIAIQTPNDPNRGRWVTAATLGYTHKIAQASGVQVGLGGSVTKDFLPSEFIGSYGSNPWTAKIFLQLSGMGMWEI